MRERGNEKGREDEGMMGGGGELEGREQEGRGGKVKGKDIHKIFRVCAASGPFGMLNRHSVRYPG